MQKHVSRAARNGFTLIELIIVIVVIASLSAIAVAGYSAVTEKAEDRAAESTLQVVDREFRANDAFNKMGDRGSVVITDMTEAAELGVTFNDEDGNDRLDTNETVTVETSEKVWTLTLKDATTEGHIGSEVIPVISVPEFKTIEYSSNPTQVRVVRAHSLGYDTWIYMYSFAPEDIGASIYLYDPVYKKYSGKNYFPEAGFRPLSYYSDKFETEITGVQVACRVVHNGQTSPSGKFAEFDVALSESSYTYLNKRTFEGSDYSGNVEWYPDLDPGFVGPNGESAEDLRWGEGAQNCYSSVEIDGQPASYWADLKRGDTFNFDIKFRFQNAGGWSAWTPVVQNGTSDCVADVDPDNYQVGRCPQ